MLASLLLSVFGLAFCVIFSADYVNGRPGTEENEECSCCAKTTYDIPKAQELTITLGYDAGMSIDIGFAKSMCSARHTFPNTVTLEFVVGYTIKFDENNNVLCINENEKTKSCDLAIQHACASALVDNFSDFCCCTMADGGDPKTCFAAKNEEKLEEYNKCVNLQDTSINPYEILITNSKNTNKNYPAAPCAPALTINEIYDLCARENFFDHPDQVVCAILADNVEPNCSK